MNAKREKTSISFARSDLELMVWENIKKEKIFISKPTKVAYGSLTLGSSEPKQPLFQNRIFLIP